MSLLFFKPLESYRLYPDLSIRVKQLGSSRRRFDASKWDQTESFHGLSRPLQDSCWWFKKGRTHGKTKIKFHQIHH